MRIKVLGAIFAWVMGAVPVCGMVEIKLTDAVQMALARNYDLQVATLDVKRANIDTSLGNAGLLPIVEASAFMSTSKNDTEFLFSSGASSSTTGSETDRRGYSVGASYVLFDGFANIHRLNQSKVAAKQSALAFRNTLENTLVQLSEGFFAIAEAQQILDIAASSLKISEKRLTKIEKKVSLGGATRLELLDATVARDTDRSAVLEAELGLSNAKRNFALIIGVEMGDQFSVEEITNLFDLPSPNVLWQDAQTHNLEINIAKSQAHLSEINYKIAKSVFFPKVTTSAKYSFERGDFDSGVFRFSQSNGYSLEIAGTWKLFDGMQGVNGVRKAKIDRQIHTVNVNRISQAVKTQIFATYTTWKVKRAQIEIEKQNIKSAFLRFEQSRQLLAFGKISAVAFREAQLDLFRARYRHITAVYAAKIAEFELKRLSGRILRPA